MKDGVFIVFEGIDGSGKTSLAEEVVRALSGVAGVSAKLTFEPHDPSSAGIFIRQVLTRKIANVPNWTLALAFATNRADHCSREIDPFLRDPDDGATHIVVCDRYYLSSLVYQSDDNTDFDRVMELNKSARRPDLTLFMNASNETCYARMSKRDQPRELFEQGLTAVRDKYLEGIDYLRARGETIEIIDAEGSFEEVLTGTLRRIRDHLEGLTPLSPPLLVPVTSERTLAAEPESIDDYCRDLIGSETLQRPTFDALVRKVDESVDALRPQEVAGMCIDLIARKGYNPGDPVPWLDLNALTLECRLPLGVTQHGAVVVLGETQRYDTVLGKLLQGDSVATLKRMSDFLFLIDTNPGHLVPEQYGERESVAFDAEASLSPSIVLIGRERLKTEVFATIVSLMGDSWPDSTVASERLLQASNFADIKRVH